MPRPRLQLPLFPLLLLELAILPLQHHIELLPSLEIQQSSFPCFWNPRSSRPFFVLQRSAPINQHLEALGAGYLLQDSLKISGTPGLLLPALQPSTFIVRSLFWQLVRAMAALQVRINTSGSCVCALSLVVYWCFVLFSGANPRGRQPNPTATFGVKSFVASLVHFPCFLCCSSWNLVVFSFACSFAC